MSLDQQDVMTAFTYYIHFKKWYLPQSIEFQNAMKRYTLKYNYQLMNPRTTVIPSVLYQSQILCISVWNIVKVDTTCQLNKQNLALEVEWSTWAQLMHFLIIDEIYLISRFISAKQVVGFTTGKQKYPSFYILFYCFKSTEIPRHD